MKKIISLVAVCLIVFGGIVFAQNVQTQITRINVDFLRKEAIIYIGTGYYDQNNNWQSVGATSTTIVDEPLFDYMISNLTQSNALNMTVVQQNLSGLISNPQEVNWSAVLPTTQGVNWTGTTGN